MRFEDRLLGVVGSVLSLGGVACDPGESPGGSTTDTAATSDLSGACDGEPLPADYQVAASGYVTVTPGSACPTAEEADLRVMDCTFLEWQDITCGLDSVAHDQVLVNNGYGGYWADAATAPTTGTMAATGDVVDVCWYEAVFYLDPNHPTCGRPLLDESRMIVAEVVPGASPWAVGRHAVVAGLSPSDRAGVGAYWLSAAVLEHASVASFSHFALDLIRFGAPPSLVAAAHRAALDEIEHARLCFALASSYRGLPVGPGPLDGTPAPAATLLALAEALVREGCVGETLAAVDAAARLAVARDPAVREALTRIVRDESAHAALAWKALAWVLQTDPALWVPLEALLARERAGWSRDETSGSAAREAHGLLSGDARTRALDRAWEEVIAPSWQALALGAGRDERRAQPTVVA